jgi:hypothetical protein
LLPTEYHLHVSQKITNLGKQKSGCPGRARAVHRDGRGWEFMQTAEAVRINSNQPADMSIVCMHVCML